jgi:hypothetical protein
VSHFTPTDCADEPFNPGIRFSFASTQARTPSALSVTVTLPSQELPRRQSHLKNNVVFLPLGTSINTAALAGGLVQCTATQFNSSSAAPAKCPSASQVGQVTFTTPLLGTLHGRVYFGSGTAANPLRLFIAIDIHGQNAKLIADNGFEHSFVVTSLANLPQVPFTRFALSFNGGPRALVLTPPCGSHDGKGVFAPWSGNAASVRVSSVRISKTSTGARCPGAKSVRQAIGS